MSNPVNTDEKQLDSLLKEFGEQVEKLQQKAERLSDTSVRLLGPRPQEEHGPPHLSDYRSDFAYLMQIKIDALKNVNSQLDEEINRLEYAV